MSRNNSSNRSRPRHKSSSSPKSGAGRTGQSRHGGRPTGGRPSGGGRSGGSRKRGVEIDPRKFQNAAIAPADHTPYIAQHKFTDFALCQKLQNNIIKRGYESPTQIQDVSIEPIIAGKDLIGLANTGTGKTAAFTLPIAELLRNDEDVRAALVLAPTRELAAQINDEFRIFTEGMGLRSSICVGGANINRQIQSLAKRPHVVIGTPGRIKDLMNRGKINSATFDVFVLDEADRMLDMGFIKDIRTIASELPDHRQTLCFSATINPAIEGLLDDFMSNPVTVSVRTSVNNDHIEQQVIAATSKEHKIEILAGLLKQPEFEKVLIFGETKHGVQRLADKLTKRGLRAEAIHGNKNQNQRQRSLNAFKQNDSRILVATDVASRGLDIPEVSHVINFDQPASYDDYIHRIGRTGRAGNGGNALTFVPAG